MRWIILGALTCLCCQTTGDDEPLTIEEVENNAQGAPCYLMPEASAPTAASCYRITAGLGNILQECSSSVDGEYGAPGPRPQPTDVQYVASGAGYTIEAFSVGAGGCYRWAACGTGPAPTIAACP